MKSKKCVYIDKNTTNTTRSCLSGSWTKTTNEKETKKIAIVKANYIGRRKEKVTPSRNGVVLPYILIRPQKPPPSESTHIDDNLSDKGYYALANYYRIVTYTWPIL